MTAPIKKTPPARKTVTRKKAPVKRTTKPGNTAGKSTSANIFRYWPVVVITFVLVLFSPFYYRYVSQGFLNLWYRINDIGEDPTYRHYRGFNIHVSEKYTIHGIDVSYAQGKIDWPKVKAMDENGLHLTFAFIKATEGENFVDPYFYRNWREAAKTGIVCGAYQFFRPRKNGTSQAKFLLKTVKPEKNDMPLVIDVEKLDGATPGQMRISLEECLAYIKYRTPAKPIIYSGLSFYTDYLKGYFDDYPLWIAHYNQPEVRINQAASNWKLWQHSDRATVNGIHHAVDFDTFKGDSAEFRQFLMR